MKKKLLYGLGLAIVALLVVLLVATNTVTLQDLKEHRAAIQSYYAENPVTTVISFSLAYTLAVALSLPIATLATLAAGAIFGPFLGTVIVDFCDTVGAAGAFLSARLLLRNWLSRRYGPLLRQLDAHVAKNALSYVLFLRLVPVIPFVLVNLLFGLTAVRLRDFVIGTAVGSIPVAFIFCNAGSKLASIESFEDVTSPTTLASLAAVGVLALVPTLYRRFRPS